MSKKRSGTRPPRGDSQVRLVGGRWRGRRLAFPDAPGLRPTGDRVRETLFNWLAADLPGARCLDAFAGSGALGFEALSRGAGEVVLIEHNPVAMKHLAAARETLAAEGATLVAADTLAWLREAQAAPFDIIFLDPPFDSDLLAATLQVLGASPLAPGGCLVYLESSLALPPLPSRWSLLKEKQAGDVGYRLAVVN